MKFNLGKFNREGSVAFKIKGSAVINFSSKINGITIAINKELKAKINIKTKSIATAYIYIKDKLKTKLYIKTNKPNQTIFTYSDGQSKIIFTAKAISASELEDVLKLENLELFPNDEIIIDLCALTVTQNGVNILDKLDLDSEFFDIIPGKNKINISTDKSASAEILWHDRWL